MSVDCHFPGLPDLRMPRKAGDAAASGIHYEGPVLSGERGVREAFVRQAYELSARLASPARFLSDSRAHALEPSVSVDPVEAARRRQFGDPPSSTYAGPGQYDAVLRSVLNLAKL